MKHRVKTLALLPLLACALLLIPLAGSVHASPAHVARSGHTFVPASRQFFSRPPIFVTKAQSLNWSGYAAVKGHYTKVSASWSEPSVTCTSEATYSAFWTGLDGDGSNTVEQTGTSAYCESGSPVYFAWYEMYPSSPVTINHPVVPGDALSASVTAVTKTSFKLVISDSTQNWTFSTTKTLVGATLASAEAIAEAPSSFSGVLPLADFGTVHFSNTLVDGKSIGSFNPQDIVMETSGGTVKAQPSALSSNGEAFSVRWKHS